MTKRRMKRDEKEDYVEKKVDLLQKPKPRPKMNEKTSLKMKTREIGEQDEKQRDYERKTKNRKKSERSKKEKMKRKKQQTAEKYWE